MSRVGDPHLDASDIRARGAVDFANDRVWLSESFITPRMSAEKAAAGLLIRLVSIPLHAILNRVVAGSGDVFYEGGARWRRTVRNRWRGPSGNRSDPKNTWHPLFLFDVITGVESDIGVPIGTELVNGIPTTQYEVRLASSMFKPDIWLQLAEAHPAQGTGTEGQARIPRKSIQAFFWLDDQSRIRRMSYEVVYSGSSDSGLWASTEFSEFGELLSLEPPVD